MKKSFKITSAIVTLALAIIISIITWEKTSYQMKSFLPGTESLSDGELTLVCHCSLWSSQSCTVDNSGAVCASGGNVHCWEYNLNCK